VCWAWVPPLEDGACHNEKLHAPVLRGLHVPILHMFPKGKRGGRHACVGRRFYRWNMAMGKINTFHAPVLRGARHVLRHVLHHALHRVLHASCDSRGCINKCPSCAGVYDYFQQHIFDKNEKAGADYYQGRGTPAYGVKLGWTNAFSDG